MNRFTMLMPRTLDEAVAVQGQRRERSLPVLKAGGMDVLDHLKEGLIEPAAINNLLGVPDADLRRIDSGSIGALCTLTQVANDPHIRKGASVIAQAAESAATPQVRNVATVAGNLLQRPRCWYYRNEQFNCLKKGGHLCYAVEGENRYHAIFGDGPCYIVHPSNLAGALMVCDGAVETRSASRRDGGRTIPLDELFTMPDRNIRGEHVLDPDEIVVRITWRPAAHSAHYAIREKQSFDWPLVMASVAFDLTDAGRIANPRLVAGAVAPIPWRLHAVEEAIDGVDPADDATLRRAAQHSIDGARPMRDNAYKLRLLPVAVRRAVQRAAGLEVEEI